MNRPKEDIIAGMTPAECRMEREGAGMDRTAAKCAIFDVDGTLYFQRPVRKGMALRLAGYFLTHPWRWKELLGIYYFRKLRETEAGRTAALEEQIRGAARRAGVKQEERLKRAIQRWMFEEPLSLIRRHANEPLLRLLREMRAAGTRVIIYSDYAPEQKLEALGVSADAVYYPGRGGIEELKPSRRAMETILKTERVNPEHCVFFGDRPERDGKSAALAGIRFLHVGSDGTWREETEIG